MNQPKSLRRQREAPAKLLEDMETEFPKYS